MNILGIDTSSRTASCALTQNGVLIAESFLNASLTHSQTIMPMIDNMLKSANQSIEDTDIFALSAGPGSFTGLRIGMAAVKGMALTLNKPCAQISTLYSLALNIKIFDGYIVPAMDARANQVYTAGFESSHNGFTRVLEDSALPVAELLQKIKSLPPKPLMFVGDGSHICLKYFAENNLAAKIAPDPLIHQRSSSLCLAAEYLNANNPSAEGRICSAAELETLYLRLSQAEREREARMNGI